LFTRHYGKYEGAEGFVAILSVLAENPNAARLKAVCIDLSAVTSVTLENTDRAYASFFLQKLASYNQGISGMLFVRVFDPVNVVINELIDERDQRLNRHLFNLETVANVHSVPDALKALGLPADYRIEYPAKN
jgi:hypothetical protein